MVSEIPKSRIIIRAINNRSFVAPEYNMHCELANFSTLKDPTTLLISGGMVDLPWISLNPLFFCADNESNSNMVKKEKIHLLDKNL